MGGSCRDLSRTIEASEDPNVGSARIASNSVSSVIFTLVSALIYASIYIILFLILRIHFPRYYRPRTFLNSLPEEQRTVEIKDGFLNWIGGFYSKPDSYVLNHHTIDGYLFLRFFKVAVICCLVGCCMTWPILWPIYATGGGGKEQFDLLTMGNVTRHYSKLFAPAGIAIVYFSFIIFMITRELIYFINLRQAYLTSPHYASRISARTVLFTSVPEDYMQEDKLRQMLGSRVLRMWFTTDCNKLVQMVKDRDSVAMKLECAETKFIKSRNLVRSPSNDYRPTHRVPFLVGKKVDTIKWCREELERLIPQINAEQVKHRSKDAKLLNSVFVEFETYREAQTAYQSLAHHHVPCMAPRFIGITPDEVIWSNVSIKWWGLTIRKFASMFLVVALIVFWSIPIAVIGAISNINYLTKCLPFLAFIDGIPLAVLGVVTGLLPTILLAVLTACLPIILRAMAELGGAPTRSAVELTVQNSYFAFQVVQVFLVATIGSAASASIEQIIQDPTSIAFLLATNIPKASNFYISYFVLQGLAIMSGLLLSLAGLVLSELGGKVLDSTPRQMYKRWTSLSGISWGTLFPIYTNLFVIALCYAVIAPLVLGFAAIGLFLLYFGYRYQLLFVVEASVDTKGLVYPRALLQVFVGLYIAELCLIGMLAINTSASPGALGPLVLMIIFLIFTALYQISLNSAIAPYLKYLPKSLDTFDRRSSENGDRYQSINLAKSDRYGTREKSLANSGHQTGPVLRNKPNFVARFLRPNLYADHETISSINPRDIVVQYTPEAEQTAFYHPAIISKTPQLWIPRDSSPWRTSEREIWETSKIIPITDEFAKLDGNNRICWKDGGPPVCQENSNF